MASTNPNQQADLIYKLPPKVQLPPHIKEMQHLWKNPKCMSTTTLDQPPPNCLNPPTIPPLFVTRNASVILAAAEDAYCWSCDLVKDTPLLRREPYPNHYHLNCPYYKERAALFLPPECTTLNTCARCLTPTLMCKSSEVDRVRQHNLLQRGRPHMVQVKPLVYYSSMEAKTPSCCAYSRMVTDIGITIIELAIGERYSPTNRVGREAHKLIQDKRNLAGGTGPGAWYLGMVYLHRRYNEVLKWIHDNPSGGVQPENLRSSALTCKINRPKMSWINSIVTAQRRLIKEEEERKQQEELKQQEEMSEKADHAA